MNFLPQSLKEAIFRYFAIKEANNGWFPNSDIKKSTQLTIRDEVKKVDSSFFISIIPGEVSFGNSELYIEIDRKHLLKFFSTNEDQALYQEILDNEKSIKAIDSI